VKEQAPEDHQVEVEVVVVALDGAVAALDGTVAALDGAEVALGEEAGVDVPRLAVGSVDVPMAQHII